MMYLRICQDQIEPAGRIGVLIPESPGEDDRPKTDTGRDRYSDIGTVLQGPRKPGREDPRGEYLTKGGKSVNATKTIKLLANENHGKFSLIATQAPLQNTINDFFELIFTSKVDAVVVLGSLERYRLEDYWNPDEKSRDIKNPEPETVAPCYRLTSEDKGFRPSYRKYEITITKSGAGRIEGTKQLSLFHYYKWPDKLVPQNPDDFENFVKSRELADKRKLLVHCSAGIGRTGTFAACLYAWKEKSKKPFAIVKSLRERRSSTVQMPEQFDYVCKFIARNCTDEGKLNPPDWRADLDYDKYFEDYANEIKQLMRR